MKRQKRSRRGTPPLERITALKRKDLISMVSDREGQALLESYCRIYHVKL